MFCLGIFSHSFSQKRFELRIHGANVAAGVTLVAGGIPFVKLDFSLIF